MPPLRHPLKCQPIEDAASSDESESSDEELPDAPPAGVGEHQCRVSVYSTLRLSKNMITCVPLSATQITQSRQVALIQLPASLPCLCPQPGLSPPPTSVNRTVSVNQPSLSVTRKPLQLTAAPEEFGNGVALSSRPKAPTCTTNSTTTSRGPTSRRRGT